jgi:hypothetical protein
MSFSAKPSSLLKITDGGTQTQATSGLRLFIGG